MTGIYRPRKLAERANLLLEFPYTHGNTIRAYIPLLENPEITEGQRARYATHTILSRPGNMFTYVGADSRSFVLKFHITLPNIVGYINEEGLADKFTQQFKLFYFSKESQKRVFLNSDETTFTQGILNKADLARKYYRSLIGSSAIPSNIVDSIANFILTDLLGESEPEEPNSKSDNAINLFLLWLNLIRCCTLNNTENTSLGPPTVRLNFGTMYNNIPCICTDYSINTITNAGYEVNTLTPRRVEISMNLSESRLGDLGKYEPKKNVKGDNITGWESILVNDTLDPYNDDWSSFEDK